MSTRNGLACSVRCTLSGKRNCTLPCSLSITILDVIMIALACRKKREKIVVESTLSINQSINQHKTIKSTNQSKPDEVQLPASKSSNQAITAIETWRSGLSLKTATLSDKDFPFTRLKLRRDTARFAASLTGHNPEFYPATSPLHSASEWDWVHWAWFWPYDLERRRLPTKDLRLCSYSSRFPSQMTRKSPF